MKRYRGFTYVTGQTYSGNFNIVGGVIQSGKSGDSDAFVTKLGTVETTINTHNRKPSFQY